MCIIFNRRRSFLVLQVQRLRKDRVTIMHSKKRKQEDARAIRMLLVLLVIFFITNAYSVILLLTRIYNVPGIKPLLFSSTIAFGFNSSMNVFLYFVMTPRFRQVLCMCLDSEQAGFTSASSRSFSGHLRGDNVHSDHSAPTEATTSVHISNVSLYPAGLSDKGSNITDLWPVNSESLEHTNTFASAQNASNFIVTRF